MKSATARSGRQDKQPAVHSEEINGRGVPANKSISNNTTDNCLELDQQWCSAIKSKIMNPAREVESSTPKYFSRFDALDNSKHPSIFNICGQPNTIAVVTIGPYHHPANVRQLITNGPDMNSQPAKKPDDTNHNRSSVPKQQPKIMKSNSSGSSQTSRQPIITEAKKSAIVLFLETHHELDISQFLGWVRGERVAYARSCYEKDSFDMADDGDFAQMLLLDGCLVLFAIFLLSSSLPRPINRKPSKMADDSPNREQFVNMCADILFNIKQLRLDLLMLDNQIPFFVVRHLHNQLQKSLFEGIDHSIEEMAISCFEDIHPKCNYKVDGKIPETSCHLLDLFHWTRSPSGKYKVKRSNFLPKDPNSHLPSATDLRESATLFKKKSSGSPLDLSFDCTWFRMRGVMRIPALYLHDDSELMFRNLIAFEQRHLKCGLSVTSYSICMAQLLQSETDAKLLRKNRILAHTNKSDQEIVDFFKKLSGDYKGTFMPSDLRKLYNDVAEHHDSKLARICGGIMLQYFPNPWITISIACGVILFLATLANNIHSMYRYYHLH